MPSPSRRLSQIVDAILAERGWRAGPSSPGLETPSQDQSQLVFIGNWQDPCPRRLLFDPNLQPVDIVTWQFIRIHAEATKVVAFPAYTELMRVARVSRATIARALAVLRLSRWLPLCAALRDPDGRFAGHVYALHDEPMPLPEILEIDAGYVRFAQDAERHRSAHVRRIAHDTLAEIETAAMGSASPRATRVSEHAARRLDEMLHIGARVQNLNAADGVQNLNAGCSSSNQETTTTRKLFHPTQGLSLSASDATQLVFPEPLSLTDSQRQVLALRLRTLDAGLRQSVLDEAAGRVVAKRSTSDPVRSEFDYVASLCTKARNGEFVPTDAGERIRRDRERRAGTEERLRRAREYSEAQRLKEIEQHRKRTEEPTDE